jgi:hypothetical protein
VGNCDLQTQRMDFFLLGSSRHAGVVFLANFWFANPPPANDSSNAMPSEIVSRGQMVIRGNPLLRVNPGKSKVGPSAGSPVGNQPL